MFSSDLVDKKRLKRVENVLIKWQNSRNVIKCYTFFLKENSLVTLCGFS